MYAYLDFVCWNYGWKNSYVKENVTQTTPRKIGQCRGNDEVEEDYQYNTLLWYNVQKKFQRFLKPLSFGINRHDEE